MSKVGEVYLVGAGPGAPDLLTIRAVQRISIGDVMVQSGGQASHTQKLTGADDRT